MDEFRVETWSGLGFWRELKLEEATLDSEFVSVYLGLEVLESEIRGLQITFWGFKEEVKGELEQSLRRVEVAIRLKFEISANGCLLLFIDLYMFGLLFLWVGMDLELFGLFFWVAMDSNLLIFGC